VNNGIAAGSVALSQAELQIQQNIDHPCMERRGVSFLKWNEIRTIEVKEDET
jgi:hypothetical protein